MPPDYVLNNSTFYQIRATSVNYQRCRVSSGADCAGNRLWYTNIMRDIPGPSVDRKMQSGAG